MKEQLKLLEELQGHDARLNEIEGLLKELPEKLEQMRADLARVEKILTQEQEKLAEAERWRREQEGQLKLEEEAIAKAKAKLQAVRTSKEYMATQREIENTRKMVGEREEEVLKLFEAVEQSKQTIAAHEADVAALREEVAKEEQAINEQIASLKEQVAGLRLHRDAVAAKVRPDVLKRYSHIRMRRGLAVVSVHDGVCSGCNMAIPPQLFNTLQRGSTLELCPACHRIIYWDRLMEEEAAPETSAAGAPDEESPSDPSPDPDAEHKAAQA